MTFSYSMPTTVFYGRGAVLEHKDAFQRLGHKAFIVTGRHSAKKNGSYDDIVQALEDANIEHVLFDEVEENPSLETIDKASALGKEKGVDFVVGIGGGSPMDAAKAIAVFIKNDSVHSENIFDQGPLEHLPIVAVATTSGTGSEVTQYSIVTCKQAQTKKNLGQVVFPALAFLDPAYTDDLPYSITVNTAIDAFSHLVEGYLSSQSSPLSDCYGEKGFHLFRSCFQKLIDRDLDKSFREDIMLASMLAGMQIAQAGTSIPHGMGYALTYFKGLPHGLANGVLTIAYLQAFKDHHKIKRMLTQLDIKDLDELQAIFDQLIDVDIDVSPEELEDYAKSFAANKAKLKNHPEEIGEEEILEIYRKSLLRA